LIHSSLDRLLQAPRYQDKKCLSQYGYKVYSQNDEDGIIREIFNRIGVTNRIFIEIGVGKGMENNTLALLFDGWKGMWIEGARQAITFIRQNLKNTIKKGNLKLLNAFVDRNNVDELISTAIDYTEIDLLSIDIDGNDFHVFDAITCIRPRVVIIEYNAKFPPPIVYCMSYNENHVWRRDDNFGASLKFLEREFSKKGYCLVGCNLTGANAFFVRNNLVGTHFLEPFTAENHYEPARYYLGEFTSGHKPSLQTLEQAQDIDVL
jgi:hypothetical protein